ncbi:MAG: hypothetical protein QOJ91_83 [Sphingomonadales bacterium]|nr:hypothetical protein [Sphingomonadales bacterium]
MIPVLVLILVRLLLSLGLFCGPFLAFAVLSRQQHAGLVLIMPLFGAVPGIMAALILFLPIEVALRGTGLENILVPLAGASLIFLFTVITQRGVRYRRSGKSGWNGWTLWSVAGAFWGVIWRLTDPLCRLAGW